jgi:hypothetical protein
LALRDRRRRGGVVLIALDRGAIRRLGRVVGVLDSAPDDRDDVSGEIGA